MLCGSVSYLCRFERKNNSVGMTPCPGKSACLGVGHIMVWFHITTELILLVAAAACISLALVYAEMSCFRNLNWRGKKTHPTHLLQKDRRRWDGLEQWLYRTMSSYDSQTLNRLICFLKLYPLPGKCVMLCRNTVYMPSQPSKMRLLAV